MKKAVPFALIALFVLGAANALTSPRIKRLSEDSYLITHPKQTPFGGRGKGLPLAHEMAGSLCEVLGFTHFEISSIRSRRRAFGCGAVTLEVKLYRGDQSVKDDEDLHVCSESATEAQKRKMRRAIAEAE